MGNFGSKPKPKPKPEPAERRRQPSNTASQHGRSGPSNRRSRAASGGSGTAATTATATPVSAATAAPAATAAAAVPGAEPTTPGSPSEAADAPAGAAAVAPTTPNLIAFTVPEDALGETENMTIEEAVAMVVSTETPVEVQKLLLMMASYFGPGAYEAISDALVAALNDAGNSEETRGAIVSKVRLWMEHFRWQFRDPLCEATQAITGFLDRMAAQPGMADEAQALRDHLMELRNTETAYHTPQRVSEADAERVPVVAEGGARLTSLTQINDVELGRQMTLQMFAAFRRITPDELLDQSWAADDVDTPGVRAFQECFVLQLNWVVREIIRKKRLSNRVRRVCRFINAAESCMTLGNYATVAAIVSALWSAPITRLTSVWASLPSAFEKKKSDLDKFVYQPGRRDLREAVRARLDSHQVTIPDPQFLTDITNLETARTLAAAEVRIPGLAVPPLIKICNVVNTVVEAQQLPADADKLTVSSPGYKRVLQANIIEYIARQSATVTELSNRNLSKRLFPTEEEKNRRAQSVSVVELGEDATVNVFTGGWRAIKAWKDRLMGREADELNAGHGPLKATHAGATEITMASLIKKDCISWLKGKEINISGSDTLDISLDRAARAGGLAAQWIEKAGGVLRIAVHENTRENEIGTELEDEETDEYLLLPPLASVAGPMPLDATPEGSLEPPVVTGIEHCQPLVFTVENTSKWPAVFMATKHNYANHRRDCKAVFPLQEKYIMPKLLAPGERYSVCVSMAMPRTVAAYTITIHFRPFIEGMGEYLNADADADANADTTAGAFMDVSDDEMEEDEILALLATTDDADADVGGAGDADGDADGDSSTLDPLFASVWLSHKMVLVRRGASLPRRR